MKVNSLERRLSEKDEEIKILTRRNHLVAKNFKTQLINEKKKYKELSNKMENISASAKRYMSSNESDRSSLTNFKEVINCSILLAPTIH